jgi:phytoene synthase
MDSALDDLVRRVDEDRWLAAQFAAPAAKERLIALYAVNFEIARTAETVSENTLGEMRLQFWREALASIYGEGEPPVSTPAVDALRGAILSADLPREPFNLLIDARMLDFPETPFATWDDLEAYVDATVGSVMLLAAKACAPDLSPTDSQKAAIAGAARAWGLCGLVRAYPFWSRARRTFFPKRLLDHTNITAADVFSLKMTHGPSAAARAVLDRAAKALQEAQRHAASLPTAAFPAVSYATLVPRYSEILMKTGILNGADSRRIGPLGRRLALVAATARGRI